MNKKQVLVIHGGTAFPSHEEYLAFLEDSQPELERMKARTDWKLGLQGKLGGGFDVFQPRMPNGADARYDEWKMWFEKVAPLLEDEIILVGHSLGGVFLAKYLSENIFPKKIRAVVLISAPFDDEGSDESLYSFAPGDSLEKFKTQTDKIVLYHSEDDPVVPFAQVKKYKERLPLADLHIFTDRGHFNQEEFPELIDILRSLA